MQRLILCLIISIVPLLTFAGNDTLVTVFGIVKGHTDGQALTRASVSATDVSDPAHVVRAKTYGDGRYELNLMEVRTYRITYDAPGHVSKIVEVDMAGPSDDGWKTGYGMNVDISLLEHQEGMDLSLFAEPFGRAAYVEGSDVFEWDTDHSRAMRDRQDALLKEQKKRQKD
jgi:hypothetical protein